MINKGCIYLMVWVTDTDSEVPTLNSVPMSNEFLEVFLDGPLGSHQTGRLILELM